MMHLIENALLKMILLLSLQCDSSRLLALKIQQKRLKQEGEDLVEE